MGPIELQGKISRLHIQRDDALRELAQLRADLTAARADVERLREMLSECASVYGIDDEYNCAHCGVTFDVGSHDCELTRLLAETAPKEAT